MQRQKNKRCTVKNLFFHCDIQKNYVHSFVPAKLQIKIKYANKEYIYTLHQNQLGTIEQLSKIHCPMFMDSLVSVETYNF